MTQNKGRIRLLREFMRLLRPLQTPSSIRWLNKDLAIGSPMEDEGWLTMRSRGVRAVVDLSEQCGGVAGVVREQGMRYLRSPVTVPAFPKPRNCTSSRAGCCSASPTAAAVLIHDTDRLATTGCVACAVLVKNGCNAPKAQDRICDVRGRCADGIRPACCTSSSRSAPWP